MIPKSSLLTLLAATFLLLTGCGNREVAYLEFRDMPSDGWRRQTLLSFDPCPYDSLTDKDSHRVEIILRHTDAVPCDSIWLAVEESSYGTTIHRDTIPVALSDASGEWLGRGAHGIYEVGRPLRSYRRLPSGYQVTLSHAMKNERIPGIVNVGIRMTRFEKQNNE